ncbi:ferlin family C2 domain-containing myoferlin misfire [Cochliomyia hominivorax]
MLASQKECFSNIVQDFLICTTIHKARQLGIFQNKIYVRISLDRMRRHTRSYENSENPYFNEYFVFDLKCTLMEMLRLTILYEVKKHTTCKKNSTVGELLIDLESVWNQPNRCYFKKWGRLEAPISGHLSTFENGIEIVENAFLQIDLAIVTQASNISNLLRPFENDSMVLNKWENYQDFDDIEKNLLQNVDSSIRCNIRYSVIFYRGVMSKKSDYFIQFRFHPFKGKTNVAKNTKDPCWNQEICFIWCFPSAAQTLAVQLVMHEHLQWKCVAEYEVHFHEIAFKDKPSLGPTFINLYDNANGFQFVGSLLLEIKSECLQGESNHVMTLTQVPGLDEKYYWQEKIFLIEFMALQGDFIHCSINNCKIVMKVGEHNSNYYECSLKNYTTSLKKGQYPIQIFKFFNQNLPFKSITLKVKLPDNRRKYGCDLILQDIGDFIKSELELFKLFQIQYSQYQQLQLNVLKVILLNIIQKMEKNNDLDYMSFKNATQWDINRLIYLKEYYHKILEDLKKLRLKLNPNANNYIELIIEDVKGNLTQYCNELYYLLSTSLVQDSWPDLLLVLLGGDKEIGYCKLNAKHFMFSLKEQESGDRSECWKLRNFIFKDIKCQHTCTNCGCIVAIIRGCLSIISDTESKEFLNLIHQNWKHVEPFYWSPQIPCVTFKCHLFIHQAKIKPGADRSGLCDPYIRVMICQNSAETPVLFSTLSPIWNSVISFANIQLPGDFIWYLRNSPLVALEVYDTDRKTSDDYLGCGVLALTVIKSDWVDWYARENIISNNEEVKNTQAIQKYELLKYLTPPPLKWVPIALNGAIRAEILMSGELVEVTEIKKTDDCEEKVKETCITVGIPNAIKPNMKNFVLEVIFAGFRNYLKKNFLTSKHRVKIMMGDLTLTSGLSTTPIRNSMNFLISYACGVVSLPEQLDYWPAIIATDVAIFTKQQETTLGATLIANSKRYLQKEKITPCIPQEHISKDDLDYITINLEKGNSGTEISETKPLIPKVSNSYWRKIFNKLKKSSQEAQTENFNLKEIYDENEYSWWTKFYNSSFIEPCIALNSFKHKLCIYQNELEKQPEFSYLSDWAEPLSMVHGVRYKKSILPQEETYATLKLKFKITPCKCERNNDGSADDAQILKPLVTALNPRHQAQIQLLADLAKITVRVYIVQGFQIRSTEKSMQADSYAKLQLGQRQVTNRAEYIRNQSNPIFGKCFQLEALLPREHILEITIFNRKDMKDDIEIGSTFIDVEDRWRSKHRATVGIANEYSSSGYNLWHDHMLPSEILNELCRNNDLGEPKIIGQTIEVDGMIFEDETKIAKDENVEERLSLTVLRNLEQLPSFGYKLVPQHVETRSLYRNECPGIEQGKIQLWLELYDGNLNISPPIDITPQPPKLYELRVIIYGVCEVILDEKNIFGTAMSDIYVKGWCSNYDEAQNTDIHYRSMNGVGNFNWRMLFPLKYSITEDMLITKKHISFMDEYELKQPPILSLQIWDNDLISADDFLGSLEINLSGFPEPYETAKKCKLPDVTHITTYGSTSNREAKEKPTRKLINLFKQKKIRGWFAFKGNQKENRTKPHIGLAGKVDLELEMLTEVEAALNPVGFGRNGPLALEEPIRPETSFNPFAKPWKGVKKIILPKLLKFFYILLILFIVVLVLIQIVARFPEIMNGLGY